MQLTASLVAGRQVAPSSGSPFQAGSTRLPAAPARQTRRRMASISCTAAPEKPQQKEPLQRPDASGRYGKFGGKYVPETLVAALAELEQAYAEAVQDPKFLVRPRGQRGAGGPGRCCGLASAACDWCPLLHTCRRRSLIT